MNISPRSNHELICMMEYDELTEAWDQLLKQAPSNRELVYVITHTKFIDEAWKQLEINNPSKDELFELARFDKKREEALSLLLQLPLTNEELSDIVCYEADYSQVAAKILLTRNPDKEQLYYIVTSNTHQKDEAAKRLLVNRPDNDELIAIIEYSDDCRLEAWEMLLKQSPAKEQLMDVIKDTDLKKEAWEQLLKQSPSSEEVEFLIYMDTEYKEEAAKYILSKPPEFDPLWRIMLKVDDISLVDNAWRQMKTLKPDDNDLLNLIRNNCVKKEEIADFILTTSSEKKTLLEIIKSTNNSKHKAAHQLLSQSPTIEELTTIIIYTDEKERAVAQLAKEIGFDLRKTNEEKHIKEIARNINENPELLCANNWHGEKAHCLAGWVTTISEDAKLIESEYNTELAGCLFLPNYAHLFYQDRDTVIEALKKK